MSPAQLKKGLSAISPKVAGVTNSRLKAQTGKLHSGRTDQLDISGGDDEHWMRAKAFLRADDHSDVTENELKEDIARVLTAGNPQVPDNVVEYSFKERSFVPIPPPGPTIHLLEIESKLLHKDSEEAHQQIVAEGGVIDNPAEDGIIDGDNGESSEKPAKQELAVAEEVEPEVEGDGEGLEDKDEEGQRKDSGIEAPPAASNKKIINQFNFCERATLAPNYPSRDFGTQTIPPPRAIFTGQVNQWVIFDAYQEDFAVHQKEKDKEKKEKPVTGGMVKKEETKKKEVQSADVTSRMLMAAKILERMVNQNTFDEIAQDFRYWEDPSDEYRDEEGTLLPLWKFVYEKTKKNHVTGVCWNSSYDDLFAVSFGCFDFMKPQPEGAICLFTLKNPSYPEFISTVDTGVMCVDIHPKVSCLIVVGLYDGNVVVYSAASKGKESSGAVCKSNSVTHKHGGTVWQVRWGDDMQDGEMNFFSVSADGFVCNWVFGQSGLSRTIVINLLLGSDPILGPDGSLVSLTGCGTSIAFHPREPLIFLVGTEEGNIYKCSTAYASLFLATYEAHHMPVYKIDFNKFYPDIFVSCSADWRVKIWEDNRSEPLFVFDLASPVGDVEWSPYSSTVFAAVTNDGSVHVFDLNINKYKAICVQPVVSKRRNKLSRIAFNFKHPIIIVGDDRGCITTLKLSPNLRKKEKQPKKGPQLEPKELEIRKLEKLLALVRDPQTVKPKVEVVETNN